MPRPNVAPRPVCRYYNTPRGCFAGERCHYLHGDPAVQKHAPYEEHKKCRFFAEGYCKRGNDCWFKHVKPEVAAGLLATRQVETTVVTDEEAACGICFEEKPALYGLLSGCSHAFCLPCIRQWRDPEGKGADMQESGTHKTCPMCRVSTKFIVPASRFYSQDDSRKAEVIENYKQSMARVPCRYFTRSKPSKRFCPFGNDCFYQHANADGTPYEFAYGVDVMMPQWQRRRRETETLSSDTFFRDPLEAALEVLEGIADTLPDEPGRTDEGARNTLTRRAMLGMHEYVMRLMRFEPRVESEPEVALEESPDPLVRDEQTVEFPSDALPIEHELHSSEENETIRPSTPTLSPSAIPFIPQTVVSSEPEFHSEDPRSPANVSRSGQLTTGDFAWMMEERREETCDE